MLVSKRFPVKNETDFTFVLASIDHRTVGDRFEGRPSIGDVIGKDGTPIYELKKVTENGLVKTNQQDVYYDVLDRDGNKRGQVSAYLTLLWSDQTKASCWTDQVRDDAGRPMFDCVTDGTDVRFQARTVHEIESDRADVPALQSVSVTATCPVGWALKPYVAGENLTVSSAENQLLWAEANWEKAIDSRTGTIRLENLSQNTQTLWATVECGRPASVF
ncbi:MULTISPECIES: hypothetical protein [Microbacterium]|uniref:hypothetical protein n=1 Tax=Microbacterium TaxID=33882 RepID=UPI001D174B1E|nr:hypothetical protein [Microbacterium testaceum]MCC4250690.1 hypothetical protein [Microbacterium testaceum]